MAESHRLQVLMALTELLQGINPSNGYDFNLSSSVFRGRAVYGEDDPPTMLSLLESPRPDFARYAGDDQVRAEFWQIMLQGWTVDDKKNPSDPLYTMAAEVENRLALIMLERNDGSGRPFSDEFYLLGRNSGVPLITNFQFGPPVVRPADQATSKACFYMTLRVGLASEFG